jgi:hypothetical protein
MRARLEPTRVATTGRLVALPANIRLGWKWLTVINTLVYYGPNFITVVKNFMIEGLGAYVMKLFLFVTDKETKS